jgi:D-3-phosphoglycerate dehydrogenase
MATQAKEIALSMSLANMHIPPQMSVSTSPTATFHSPPGHGSFGRARSSTIPAKQLKPFNTTDIKILLLENVNQSGKDILSGQGYQVEALKTSLPEDQLIEKIRFVVGHQLPLQLPISCVTFY